MIVFKFHGEKDYRDLPLQAHQLTADIVKAAICEQLKLSTAMDLEMENEKGEAITPDTRWSDQEKISVVCRRVPRARDPNITTVSLAATAAQSDFHRIQEDAAIEQLCQRQAPVATVADPETAGPVLRYSRSYRQAVKYHEKAEKKALNEEIHGTAAGEVKEERRLPAGYVCNRCGNGDHWHYNCPTLDDPDHVRKVRTAKGIPRFYLTKVKDVEEAQAKSLGGVTFVIPGNQTHYIWSHNPDKQEHRDRVGDTIQEKVVAAFSDGAKQVVESLKCPLCCSLFRSAMLAPCCGASFCGECAIERMCHSGATESRCPNCSKELLAHQLIPNQDLQSQIDAVVKATTRKSSKTSKKKTSIDTIRLSPPRKPPEPVPPVVPKIPPKMLPADDLARLSCSLRLKGLCWLRKPGERVPEKCKLEGESGSVPSTSSKAPAVVHPSTSSKSPPMTKQESQPNSPKIESQTASPPLSPDSKVATQDEIECNPSSPEWAEVLDCAESPDEWAVLDFLPLEEEIDPPVAELKPPQPPCPLKRPPKPRKEGVKKPRHDETIREKRPAEPLSRNEFKKVQQAWEEYNEKMARKAQRQASRESRQQARQTK